ncbi:hypothetical protein G6L37_16210 [Agrobacterium rubi]|nr:hypothetical protein [Agrobacterium rubi]NTF26913.1 hypothetical protein [Agrobacterium rubi]
MNIYGVARGMKETNMDNKYSHHTLCMPIFKPQVEEIFQRLVQASLRLETHASKARRLGTLSQFDAAVASCVNGLKHQSVRYHYLRLERAVLEEFGNADMLPSERTFRRRVERAQVAVATNLRAEKPKRRGAAYRSSLGADIAVFDGRTFGSVLRSIEIPDLDDVIPKASATDR